MKDKNLMITGAAGQLGSKVLEILTQNFQGKLIAGSRHPEKLKAFEKSGVELRQIDFDQIDTLEKGFLNVDKLLIISTDSLAVPGLRLKQHLNAIQAAKAAGVNHIVYTSLTGAEDSPIFFSPDHYGTEEAIKASGLDYTILRHNWYVENLLPSLGPAIQTGIIETSTGDGKVAFISRDDCARVDAYIMISDKFKNVTIDVTGEKAYSYSEISQCLSECVGRHIEHKKVRTSDLRSNLASQQFPSFVIDLISTYEEAVAKGYQEKTNHFVRELTGIVPKSLFDYIKDMR